MHVEMKLSAISTLEPQSWSLNELIVPNEHNSQSYGRPVDMKCFLLAFCKIPHSTTVWSQELPALNGWMLCGKGCFICHTGYSKRHFSV